MRNVNLIPNKQAKKQSKRHSWWKRGVQAGLSLLILSIGITGALYVNITAPKPQRKAPVKVTPLVETKEVYPSREKVVVKATGTVTPAREIMLKTRVSGEIIKIHPEFKKGGFLNTGDEIVKIDPEDYKLAVAEKQKEVINADYQLKLELGHQDVAKREWEILNGGKPAEPLDMELALRKPHLEKARADLDAAEAALRQAKLDLSRTRVLAPFNAVVRTKDVDLGSQVSTETQLAELVGTDEYWIKVSLPLDSLQWISIPSKNGEKGSRVRISYRSNSKTAYQRTGTVIKLLSDLETEGRMARILVSVKDPLNLLTPKAKTPLLLINEYVRVEIEGRELRDVFLIPRTALHDDAFIWVAGDGGKLDIREVKTVWRDTETVILKDGLKEGEQLIVTDLGAPVQGMAITVDAKEEKSIPSDISARNQKREGR